MPSVELDDCELAIIQTVASWRVGRVLSQSFGEGHGEVRARTLEARLPNDIIGVCGEIAWAKFHGVYWGGGADNFAKEGDVLSYEIRTTKHRNGNLIIFPNDPPDRRIFLVISLGQNRWGFPGSALPINFRHDRYIPHSVKIRPGSPPQWWVPQSRLEPLKGNEKWKP